MQKIKVAFWIWLTPFGKDVPHTPGEQVRHVVELIEKAQLAAMTGQAQLLTSKVSGAA